MVGDFGEEEKGGGLGREGKGRLLFISAKAGICKFLIGGAIMSNLLTYISKKHP